MSIEEAERVFQEFERNHNPGWDLRLYHPRIYFPLHLPVRTAEVAAICNISAAKIAGVTPTLAGKM